MMNESATSTTAPSTPSQPTHLQLFLFFFYNNEHLNSILETKMNWMDFYATWRIF